MKRYPTVMGQPLRPLMFLPPTFHLDNRANCLRHLPRARLPSQTVNSVSLYQDTRGSQERLP